jgi:hypothetical protein
VGGKAQSESGDRSEEIYRMKLRDKRTENVKNKKS